MANKLDRAEIAALVAQKMNMDKNLVMVVIKEVTEVVSEHIAVGTPVEIHDLGSFSLKNRAPRSGNTGGKEWSVGKRLNIDFKAFKSLRDTVTKTQGIPCIG